MWGGTCPSVVSGVKCGLVPGGFGSKLGGVVRGGAGALVAEGAWGDGGSSPLGQSSLVVGVPAGAGWWTVLRCALGVVRGQRMR